MGVFRSTRSVGSFFAEKEFQRYQKFRDDPRAALVYAWLQSRFDMLLASVLNHQRPALQGVIRELELFLCDEFGWSKESRGKRAPLADRREIEFFVSMIGAMAKHLLQEYKFERGRKGIPLRHSDSLGLVRTAAEYSYNPELPGLDPFEVSARARPGAETAKKTKK